MSREWGESVRGAAVAAAMAVGLVVGRLWVHAGVGWSSNALNWLQNASALMLVGGLRGLVTRLTLWLALLGASLATSRNKHIHVDVLVHYLPPRVRAATAIAGWLAAAAVCVLGVVGFADYISIAEYRVESVHACPGDPAKSCDTSPGEKFAAVRRLTSSDFFLLGRQLSLDAKTLPEVLAGHPYDKWMTAVEWNTWLAGADWTAHFDGAAVDALRIEPLVAERAADAAGGRAGYRRRGARSAHPRAQLRISLRARGHRRQAAPQRAPSAARRRRSGRSRALAVTR